MKSTVVQQTLHGYAEGHRLLDGSVKLPDELARLMLRMSDLSGSNVVSGFEEYVTGYPLESVDMYALAKTWYAAEMPRPGCVWTHTLLIPGNIMAEISFLGALASLFIRPHGSVTRGKYSKPIEVDLSEVVQEVLAPSNSLPNQILEIVETLYGRGKDNILISAHSSRGYESAIFSVWSQQWPQLSKVFSFCTGALSARGFGGKPFDIQCAHPSLIREITTAIVAKQSQEISLLVTNEGPHTSWIDRAAQDALTANGGQFRQLLWGLAEGADRKSFGRFAMIIDNLLSASPNLLSELLGKVEELFPNPNSGNLLKTTLFGAKQSLNEFNRFDEGELLAAIATTDHPEAFSSDGLRLRERGRDLCRLDPQSARHTISKLFRLPINQLGEDVIAGMIEAVNPVIAREITSEQPQFLPTLFRAKPELGTSPELWIAAGDRKRELFESLISHEKLDDALIMQIVQAILESDSESLLRRALESWGKPAVFGTFDWIAKHEGVLSDRSVGALTFHVTSVVEWLLATPERPRCAVIAAAHIVAPYSYQIRESDTQPWLRTFRELVKDGRDKDSIYFATFLLALGLQNAPPVPLTLIAETFERVHQAAWDEALPDNAWVILDPIVPHLWWHHDWDKCERMRRGLIEAFVKNHWPSIQLVECIPNQDLLVQVVTTASKVSGGKEIISGIK
ncbi:MAG: hypothetical protein ABSA83_07880 [Verrucomicrobiota bacterium]|jgi:hypothetical protein